MPCATAAAGSRNLPPSENESGVAFTIPITSPRTVRSYALAAVGQTGAAPVSAVRG
jgi:hypothetical protein